MERLIIVWGFCIVIKFPGQQLAGVRRASQKVRRGRGLHSEREAVCGLL